MAYLLNCPNCGAPIQDDICPYCGSVFLDWAAFDIQKPTAERKISVTHRFSIEVVDSLPTSEISKMTIYILTSGDETQNLYTEYIYVNGVWEKLSNQQVLRI